MALSTAQITGIETRLGLSFTSEHIAKIEEGLNNAHPGVEHANLTEAQLDRCATYTWNVFYRQWSNEFTWSIIEMERFDSYNGMNDVVCNVHFKMEKNSDGKYVNSYGNIWLININNTDNDVSSYTAYNSLTESQVITWVQDKLKEMNPEDCWNMEDDCLERFNNDSEPSRSFGLPW